MNTNRHSCKIKQHGVIELYYSGLIGLKIAWYDNTDLQHKAFAIHNI